MLSLLCFALLAIVNAGGPRNAGISLWENNAIIWFGENADVNLYRNSSTTLKTDNNLIVAGDLIVQGNIQGNDNYPNLILTPTTVYVGHGQQFTSFSSMYSWLSSQGILAPLTVQFLPGTYNVSRQVLSKLSSPQLITIQGNVSYPQNVKLMCTNCVGTYDEFFTFNGGLNDITFQGFTLSTYNPSVLAIALMVGYDTVFFSGIHISNFAYGIDVGSNGAVNAPYTVMTGCSQICVIASYNAYVLIDGSSFTGTGGSSIGLQIQGGWGSANSVSYTSFGTGFICYTNIGSYVQTSGSSTFSGVTTHINCPTTNYD